MDELISIKCNLLEMKTDDPQFYSQCFENYLNLIKQRIQIKIKTVLNEKNLYYFDPLMELCGVQSDFIFNTSDVSYINFKIGYIQYQDDDNNFQTRIKIRLSINLTTELINIEYNLLLPDVFKGIKVTDYYVLTNFNEEKNIEENFDDEE